MDGRATVVFIADCPWDQLLADAQIMGDREMVERILRVVHVDPGARAEAFRGGDPATEGQHGAALPREWRLSQPFHHAPPRVRARGGSRHHAAPDCSQGLSERHERRRGHGPALCRLSRLGLLKIL